MSDDRVAVHTTASVVSLNEQAKAPIQPSQTVTDAELARADKYEVAANTRVAATLASGKEAWVYVDARAGIAIVSSRHTVVGDNVLSFLRSYGFGRARGYFLLLNNQRYDSKAIVGVAHKLVRPDVGRFGQSISAAARSVRREYLSRHINFG